MRLTPTRFIVVSEFIKFSSSQLSTTQLNDFYVNNSWRIISGFLLCLLGGFSRSYGLTQYRAIKTEVFPETIVFWHAVQSVLINIPVMMIFSNGSIPGKFDKSQRFSHFLILYKNHINIEILYASVTI